jgi:hypothetical protein
MRSAISTWLSACVIAPIVQGCAVGPIPTTPAVVGRVVDAETKNPISGARVGIRDIARTFVATGSDGGFHVKRTSFVCVIGVAIVGDYPLCGTLVVEAPGYRRVELPIDTHLLTLRLDAPIELSFLKP